MRMINNEQCKQIGKGEFCTAYRSINTPDVVYLVCKEGDYVKEILEHIQDNPHIPTIKYIDSTDIRGKKYTIWQTTYSNKLTAKHTQAWRIYQTLKNTWESTPDVRPCPVYGSCKERLAWLYDWHIRCDNFIQTLKENQSVPESIIAALRDIYLHATEWDSTFRFDFKPQNLGISNDGTLMLRDVIFFRTYEQVFPRY